jgi:lipopolysaccharide biosynthesis glycosyltransferase
VGLGEMKINKRKPIIVCLQADKKFIMQLAVSIWSLVHNYADSRKMFIYIISNDISEDDMNKINKVHEKNLRVQIVWKKPIKSGLDKAKIARHWPITALFRLQIPLLLEHNVDKAIYLDSDIVVLGNVAELWDIGITESYLAACGEKGFNSGVMLINIKRWREKGIGQKCIQYLEKYNSKYEYSDQDALNQVLKDRWKKLDWKWNKSPNGYTPSTRIIHFMTKRKPWTIRGAFVPCRKLWYDYLDITPWAGWRLTYREMLCQSKRLMKSFFS